MFWNIYHSVRSKGYPSASPPSNINIPSCVHTMLCTFLYLELNAPPSQNRGEHFYHSMFGFRDIARENNGAICEELTHPYWGYGALSSLGKRAKYILHSLDTKKDFVLNYLYANNVNILTFSSTGLLLPDILGNIYKNCMKLQLNCWAATNIHFKKYLCNWMQTFNCRYYGYTTFIR